MRNETSNQMAGSAALLLAAFIWGFAFVAQRTGMDYVGPITFQCSRSLMGCLTLLPMILFRDLRKPSGADHPQRTYAEDSPAVTKVPEGAREKKSGHLLLTGGLITGVTYTVACCFQQYGLLYVDVGKAGFLTSIYLVMVPLCGVFLGEKIGVKVWGCVVLAISGMALLSLNGPAGFGLGDILILLCAVFYTLQIRAIGHFAPQVDSVKLSFLEFAVSVLLTAVPMFILEKPQLSQLVAGAVPILYAGVCSCGIAYTLQIVGQKYAPPTTATLLMSMESVFAMIGGVWLLHQIPTRRELLGCLLILTAVVMVQLPGRRHREVLEPEEN